MSEEFAVGAEGVESSESTMTEGVSQEPVATESATNPWSWADEAGVKPEDVQKTWSQYTQRTQELSAKEQELKPWMEFANEIQSNPELKQYIESYYDPSRNPQRATQELSSKLEAMQFQMYMNEQLDTLEKSVGPNDPPVNRQELMDFASSNGIGDLEAAYLKMNKDKIREAARLNVESEIKKSKGAYFEGGGRGEDTTAASDVAKKAKSIQDMSSEEFLNSYDSLYEFFKTQR